MRREIPAVLLLSALILGSVVSARHMDVLSTEIASFLAESQSFAERGDRERAADAAEKALTLWLDAYHFTSVFLRHSESDGLCDALCELLSAIGQDEPDALSYAYAKVLYHLESIDKMEHAGSGSVW